MFEHASLALFECLMGKLRFILHFDLEAQAKQRDDCDCLDLRKSKTAGLLRNRSKWIKSVGTVDQCTIVRPH